MDLSQVMPASDLVSKPLIIQDTQNVWIRIRNIWWQHINPTVCHYNQYFRQKNLYYWFFFYSLRN